MKKQVIITSKVHNYLISSLQQKGYGILHTEQISYEELSAIINQADGLIVTTRLQIDRAILEKATKLKWIGRLGSGLELIDVEFAESKGKNVSAAPKETVMRLQNMHWECCLALPKKLTKVTIN